MVWFQAAVCALAVSAGGETVLLDFSAPWCGPCRQMEPVVRQLAAAGHPVRAVNIDQQQELAARFGVTSVPCFVMLVDGREVDRVVGATSQARLEQMLAARQVAQRGVAPVARAQSPEIAMAGALPSAAMPSANAPPSMVRVSSARTKEVDARLLAATVRIRINDADGNSVGTGTIIDTRSGEALIVTCGHIFRSSKGNGKIAVDMFGPGAVSGLPARLVSYDLDNDVALVSVRPNVPVTPAPLAAQDYAARQGEPVISLGCDHGADATVQRTRVTAINKYLGAANLQVDGQPVQGRSGGGLFTADGRLIGVCNAADPQDNEGLFASLPVIYGELDKRGLTTVLAGGGNVPSVPKQMPPVVATPTAPPSAVAPAPAPETTAALSPSEVDALAEIQARAANPDAEVICIVRSRSNPTAKSEIIVLDRASPKFIEQLASQGNTTVTR